MHGHASIADNLSPAVWNVTQEEIRICNTCMFTLFHTCVQQRQRTSSRTCSLGTRERETSDTTDAQTHTLNCAVLGCSSCRMHGRNLFSLAARKNIHIHVMHAHTRAYHTHTHTNTCLNLRARTHIDARRRMHRRMQMSTLSHTHVIMYRKKCR